MIVGFDLCNVVDFDLSEAVGAGVSVGVVGPSVGSAGLSTDLSPLLLFFLPKGRVT